MSKVFRRVDGKGWAWSSYDDDALGPEWRRATQREWWRYQLTSARFSWVDLAAILTIATLVRLVTEI